MSIRVLNSKAVAGAARHSIGPFLVCFPWKQSAILEKPSEMGQPYYEKQVSLSSSKVNLSWILSTKIPLFRATHPFPATVWTACGSELHPSLEISLPKVHPLPGMALASDWLMEESKGPASSPWNNTEEPSHSQSSPDN